MIHTPLNYSSAEQWAGFPHTPGDGGEEERDAKGVVTWRKERGVNTEDEYGTFFFLKHRSIKKLCHLIFTVCVWPATKVISWSAVCAPQLKHKKESHPWTTRLPLMPSRYAEAPQGQCEVPCKVFEIPNTHVHKHLHSHPPFIHVFLWSAGKSVIIDCLCL